MIWKYYVQPTSESEFIDAGGQLAAPCVLRELWKITSLIQNDIKGETGALIESLEP